MNNQAPLLFRRGAFTLSETDRRQPVCHIRPRAAMTPPVHGFRIETHAFHAESAARAFFKTRKDLNFDGILLNVTFEDNWKELYDGAKVEYGADGVMRCLRLDYSSAMALHRIAVAEGKRRAFSVRGEKAVFKGEYGLGQRPAERHAGKPGAYVRDMLACGMPGGGYILSTACSVAPGVKPEILRQLVPLAEKYGVYTEA